MNVNRRSARPHAFRAGSKQSLGGFADQVIENADYGRKIIARHCYGTLNLFKLELGYSRRHSQFLRIAQPSITGGTP
jgi:hypothetical protein